MTSVLYIHIQTHTRMCVDLCTKRMCKYTVIKVSQLFNLYFTHVLGAALSQCGRLPHPMSAAHLTANALQPCAVQTAYPATALHAVVLLYPHDRSDPLWL